MRTTLPHWLLRVGFWLTTGIRLLDMGCGTHHPPPYKPVPLQSDAT